MGSYTIILNTLTEEEEHFSFFLWGVGRLKQSAVAKGKERGEEGQHAVPVPPVGLLETGLL